MLYEYCSNVILIMYQWCINAVLMLYCLIINAALTDQPFYTNTLLPNNIKAVLKMY